ncbi:RICIN domain-containing protein [Candidatus Saccharibacteria bacterium]|nr:RICIN domain-containing protein [Candidatus Saccharibacteria bacterium]
MTVRRRRDKRIWYVLTIAFVAVGFFSFLTQREEKAEVEAASLDAFDAGYIISDYQMKNYQSMTEAKIQEFLTKKNGCKNTDVGLYNELSGKYSTIHWHFSGGHFVCLSEELFGDGIKYGEDLSAGEGETAAHIIWQAAQDYKINPQVLIVLLEKEQGLITDPYPHSGQYRSATGYGCPDTAPCNEKYYGFKNQVRKAAELFKAVLDGGWTNYPLGQNYIQYNPSASCGGSMVNVRNLATSALYRYTPYQPNAAALAAGYGTAECGAYGNRNFYLYFQDWFGGIVEEGSAVAESEDVAEVAQATIEDGLYVITSTKNKKVIDIKNGVTKTSTSGEITLWDKKGIYDDTTNQVFAIKYDKATGYYKILNNLSRIALDVKDGKNTIGTPVIVWSQNSGCNQNWIIKEVENGYSILSACSKMALTVSGEQIVIDANNKTIDQKWTFEKVTAKEILKGDYKIIPNGDTKLSLDISGGVSENTNMGEAIIYNFKTGDDLNQTFTIKKDEDSDFYYIYNPTTNLYLDVADNSINDNAKVIFWPLNGGCNQKWAINKINNFYLITSSCTKKALDVRDGLIKNMSDIIMYRNHGGINQQWIIKKIK